MDKEKYEIKLTLTSTDGKNFSGSASFHHSYGDGNGSTIGCSGDGYKSLDDIIKTIRNILPKSMK